MEISKEDYKKILDDNIRMLMELKIRRVNDLALTEDPEEKEAIQKNISELDEVINYTREGMLELENR